MTFIKVAVAFIGKGSSAIKGRPFRAVRAELYYCWTGYGGLYELGYHRSLTLVKGEGEASRAYMGGACADGAYMGKACADGACADGACAGRACADRACADRACADGAYADKAYVGGACADGACADRACVGKACADRACVDRAYTDRACVGKRSFKTARARTRVADDVKGVNERDLKR